MTEIQKVEVTLMSVSVTAPLSAGNGAVRHLRVEQCGSVLGGLGVPRTAGSTQIIRLGYVTLGGGIVPALPSLHPRMMCLFTVVAPPSNPRDEVSVHRCCLFLTHGMRCLFTVMLPPNPRDEVSVHRYALLLTHGMRCLLLLMSLLLTHGMRCLLLLMLLLTQG